MFYSDILRPDPDTPSIIGGGVMDHVLAWILKELFVCLLIKKEM